MNKKIVIDLGLDPQHPCPAWDRELSGVTDGDGFTIGYVDANDGMNVVIWVEVAE